MKIAIDQIPNYLGQEIEVRDNSNEPWHRCRLVRHNTEGRYKDHPFGVITPSGFNGDYKEARTIEDDDS